MINKKVLFGLYFAFVFFVTNSQTLNYYYGNLHSHTGYSDGSKDSLTSGVSKPAGAFAFAKLSLHFDFLGISEHNHYSSNNNPGMVVTSYALGLAEAAAANQPGTFLAMYGMEWGTSSTPNGHVVVYGFNQLIGWETSIPGLVGPNYNIFNAQTDYDGLFRKVKNNPNAFATLAHPYKNDYNYLALNSYVAAYDSAIVASPLRNGLAFSTCLTYTDYPLSSYFDYFKQMLKTGYHVGITYDHDNHNTTFGRSSGGRLVVMAPALTQTDLFDAMKKRHFFASDDWNVQMDFKIGTNVMGDTTSGNSNPTINVIHNDLDGELADSVKIWSGTMGGAAPMVIASTLSLNTLSYTDNTIVLGTTKYYFVEIRQADGDYIVTSPIWYTKRNFAGIKELQNDISFLMFPNPVNSRLYLSTGLNTNYTVEIMDAAGKNVLKETYNIPDISIAMDKIAKGFYNIKITSGVFSKTKALVIE